MSREPTAQPLRGLATDPVTLEVIRQGLTAAAEQMAVSIERSAQSQVIREMLDYSSAIFDRDGGIIAQSTRIPIHLNSMSRAVRTILDQRRLAHWRAGDVFATNDPYSGGQHLPDIQTFAPVMYEGRHVAIVGTLGHHLDIGGRAAGGYGADATDIFQEGMRIPPCRIVSEGALDELFLELFRANVRVPAKTVADLRAQIAALSIGATEVLRIVERFGPETLMSAARELIESARQRMLAAIARLPKHACAADDVVDGDGIDEAPLAIRAVVRRSGDDLLVDLSGSAPQARGPINCPIASTESAVYYAVTAVLDPGTAPNDGTYGPIRVLAPEGSIVNPRFPAPVVGRNVVAHRVANVVMAALGAALPTRAAAAYYGNSNVYVLSTRDDSGATQIQFEIEVGGWGGRPGSDGPDCLSAGLHNLANNPVELVENEFPVRLLRYGLRRDSGGPGRHRGGLGAERAFEVLADCELSTQFDRVRFPPPGLHGGCDGAPAKIFVERAGAVVELPGKTLGHRLRRGDRVTILTQGGGGLGNPRERSRKAIAADVAAGKVSAEAARGVYGFDDGRSP